MTPPSPELEYLPVTYQHRQTAFVPAAILCVALFAVGLGFYTIGNAVWHAALGLAIAAGALACLAGHSRMAWECRVEGSSFVYRTPFYGPFVVAIDDIIDIETASGEDGRTAFHELTTHRAGRLVLSAVAVGDLPPLRAALLAVNPRIVFAQRDLFTCGECRRRCKSLTDAPRFFWSLQPPPECEHCGAPRARPGWFV